MSNLDENYGFIGDVPLGVSVQQNIGRALEYQKSHTAYETAVWFYEIVRNNRDGHMSLGLSMDYKQLGSAYEDFGNYNYAIVGKALGYGDGVLRVAAGYAQGDSRGKNGWFGIIADPGNFGDDSKDQYQIWKGIIAADANGLSSNWNVSQNVALAGFVVDLILGSYSRMPATNSATQNIGLGLSPTGEPLNTTIGDPLGNGSSSTWLKDTSTGSFIRVVSYVSDKGVTTVHRIDYKADGTYAGMKTYVTDSTNQTTMVFDDLPIIQQQTVKRGGRGGRYRQSPARPLPQPRISIRRFSISRRPAGLAMAISVKPGFSRKSLGGLNCHSPLRSRTASRT